MDPGYNPVALKNHGYHISSYWRGALQPFNSGFVGWNGREDEIKSSQEILEEVLLLPNSTTLALAGYTKDHVNFEEADVTFRNGVGRCMVINPPLIKTNFHRLVVGFNTSAFVRHNLSSFEMQIYIVDKANSPHLFPNMMDLVGDTIYVGLEQSVYTWQARISRSEHVEGDPLFDCAVYTKHSSYDKCIRKELEEVFIEELGCLPPLLSENLTRMCNRKFNVSLIKSNNISSLFQHLFLRDMKFSCKTPCTKSKYTTRFLAEAPHDFRGLDIVFDNTVDITRARFSIDEYTFLTKSGGFIGVGRTLLWILVSLLGTAQVM